ncbi:MAG: class I SAM-dependent DNA methyltransferase [Chloroflexota bacterium]
MNHSETVNFIWNLANMLRDDFRRSKYPDVILPFTVLRRIDLVMSPTREAVRKRHAQLQDKIAPDALDRQLRRASGFAFYNTSRYDFDRLYQDADNVGDNLRLYINAFSPNMREVIEMFNFANTITQLENSNLLYLFVGEMRKADLHPDRVNNTQMGTIFEELIRKFNEASNENPGEHFTPPDVVMLMAELLMAGDDDFIGVPKRTVTVYDPCCGTGGMLIRAKERIMVRNPEANVILFGQEVNPETYAVCKSDLYMKSEDGRDADNIAHGSTLSDDQHSDKRFNYLLANPPYGKDWRKDAAVVQTEAKRLNSRFSPGLPRSSDGQTLFLLQMVARMQAGEGAHSRMAVIMNGSPLFTGDAGSGESEIRRWVLENDWLEAIIALPEQLFYNTGIGTYVWVLSKDKRVKRQGQVQLIDATTLWEPMRKSLGDKRRQISDGHLDEIVATFLHFADKTHSKLFATTDFGYRKIKVERPLRLNLVVNEERLARLQASSAFTNLVVSKKRNEEAKRIDEAAGRTQQAAILNLLGDAVFQGEDRQSADKQGKTYMDRSQFLADVKQVARREGMKLSAAQTKMLWQTLGERDEMAEICRDSKGNAEPDADLRDYERVPLNTPVVEFFAREVLPYVADAWIDEGFVDDSDGQVGKVGYEINFNRYFYVYEPPRGLESIEADIRGSEARIGALLEKVQILSEETI